MKEEINEIISKNLPAQVGDVLKERLAQAEADKKKVADLEEMVNGYRSEISGLNSTIEKYRVFDTRNNLLEVRERELSESERNFKISTLEYQLQSEKDKTEFTKGLAMGLVRNTEFKKSVFDSENQNSYSDSAGNWHHPTPVNKSLQETKTAE